MKFWSETAQLVSAAWKVGRGYRYLHSEKHDLIITLTTIKNSKQQGFLAKTFRMKRSTFEWMIFQFINVVFEIIYDSHAQTLDVMYPIVELLGNKNIFQRRPYCRYTMKLTFQHTNRRMGNMDEAKLYYSAKHKLYGYKVNLSMLPNEKTFSISPHHPLKEQDIKIIMGRLHVRKSRHRKAEVKTGLCNGELNRFYSENFQGLFFQKGYQVLRGVLHVIYTKRFHHVGISWLKMYKIMKIYHLIGVLWNISLDVCTTFGQY